MNELRGQFLYKSIFYHEFQYLNLLLFVHRKLYYVFCFQIFFYLITHKLNIRCKYYLNLFKSQLLKLKKKKLHTKKVQYDFKLIVGTVPPYYRDVYDVLCPSNNESISQNTITQLLNKSGLERTVLNQVIDYFAIKSCTSFNRKKNKQLNA